MPPGSSQAFREKTDVKDQLRAGGGEDMDK